MKSEDKVQVSGGYKVLDENGNIKQEGEFKTEDEMEFSRKLEKIIKEHNNTKGGDWNEPKKD